ncbi:probable l-isoaspartyl protein carboxyl methyltransferase [Ustilago trichophora]|uniref:Protein-L-isoaspartate O-methyltransferase n=1 Tax=Ustilago trichophora TaxID=86804 RepID=A0A5C3E475_9BASI|nr:probable l-isoaspartyl protein carboxyl methyltransferase [Ustilago trichophora]
MAWRCSGSTNAELIHNMVNAGLIASSRVASAMSAVDRAHYVVQPRYAYQDSPQSIGFGATISAPHMHAHAAESLLPFLNAGAKVLDVGSGSGYLLAIFHHLVSTPEGQGKKGKVVGIDHIQALVDAANENLKKDGLGGQMAEENEERGCIVNLCGDGRKGVESEAPFDAIHVGAAAEGIPEALVQQLKAPGRMFIPVEEDGGSGEQYIWQVDKAQDGTVTKEKICGVLYVPLTDADKQWSR